VLDVGCGRGISSSYFLEQGAEVLCVEGSHDAVERSLLPKHLIVEHDYARGIWFPSKTYDALWCVEFLEHVGRKYMANYIPTFRRAALVFITSSHNGGWHHVETHETWWWITKLEMYGFVYSDSLTLHIKNSAAATSVNGYGLRIINRMMVFINPSVASLPQHKHLLFGRHGCLFDQYEYVPCDEKFKWYNPEVDLVPNEFRPLLNCNFIPKVNKNIQSTKANISEVHGLGVWNCSRNALIKKG
jgi:hypothetical protein